MITYFPYNHEHFLARSKPPKHVSTNCCAFNIAGAQTLTNPQLPLRMLDRMYWDGVESVVLRGCLSLNPQYQLPLFGGRSKYHPLQLFKRAIAIPTTQEQKNLVIYVKAYFRWLADIINNFPFIKYVEVLNEVFYLNLYRRARFNWGSLFKQEIAVLRTLCRADVMMGISEPLINTRNVEHLVQLISNYAEDNNLYIAFQIHRPIDWVTLHGIMPSLAGHNIAISENYTDMVVPGSFIYVSQG